jgi:hypothetical protein
MIETTATASSMRNEIATMKIRSIKKNMTVDDSFADREFADLMKFVDSIDDREEFSVILFFNIQ